MAEEMNCKERLFAALDQNPIDRVPCPGVLQTGTVELMDACGAYWPEAHTDPEKMVKLAWAAHEFGGVESVRVPFTAFTEHATLGAELEKWKKDNHPVVKKYALQSIEDVEKLEVPDFRTAGGLGEVVLKAVEMLAPRCEKAKLPIIISVMAPLNTTFNTAMLDMTMAMKWFKTNPEVIDIMFKKSQDISVAFAEAAVDAGADVILYNDAVAGLISPKDYENKFFEGDKDCVRRIKKLGTYLISHICADLRPMLPVHKDVGVHGISMAQMVPITEAREIVGDSVALVGGSNQIYTLIRKGPEEVMAEAKKAIEDGVDVLAPGCGFGPKTPIANMRAMLEAAKKYGGSARLAKK